MLDVRAAVSAVPAPGTTKPLAFATPAAPTPGATITLDGSTSVPAAGQTISSTTGYKWTMVNSGNIATFVGVSPVTSPTATVNTTGEGQFIVQLEVTDSSNGPPATTQLIVNVANPVVPSGNPTNPGGGGGGSLSWPWLLGLCVAVASLRPRRR
jgi:hypothetical protein